MNMVVDLKNAFGEVNHHLLVETLKLYHIPDNVITRHHYRLYIPIMIFRFSRTHSWLHRLDFIETFYKVTAYLRYFLISSYTAWKTIFPNPWNIIKNSKIPRKYKLSINFLDKKNTIFPTSEKFKTRTFSYSKNMVFHAEKSIILHQLFESKEDRISHLWEVQNNNFPIIWTFPFVQSSCFCNNSFFFFHRNLCFFWPF